MRLPAFLPPVPKTCARAHTCPVLRLLTQPGALWSLPPSWGFHRFFHTRCLVLLYFTDNFGLDGQMPCHGSKGQREDLQDGWWLILPLPLSAGSLSWPSKGHPSGSHQDKSEKARQGKPRAHEEPGTPTRPQRMDNGRPNRAILLHA